MCLFRIHKELFSYLLKPMVYKMLCVVMCDGFLGYGDKKVEINAKITVSHHVT